MCPKLISHFTLSGHQKPNSLKKKHLKQHPMPTKRLKNTIMNKDKITKQFNEDAPFWKVSLASCMRL